MIQLLSLPIITALAPAGSDLNMVLTFEAAFRILTLEFATTVSALAGVVVVGGLVTGVVETGGATVPF